MYQPPTTTRAATLTTVTISLFSACGTGENTTANATTTRSITQPIDNTWGGFSWELAKAVNPALYTPQQIVYPATGFFFGDAISYSDSITQGVATCATMIENCGGQFVLVGYSQGAELISQVLQELQSGALTAYMPKLVAGVTFGNPMREQGHTWPNDPTGCTGQGINGNSSAPTSLLQDTPTTWWDMTNTYDLAGNIPTGSAGAIINDIWTAMGQVSVQSITQVVNVIANVAQGNDDPLGSIISGLLSNPLAEGEALTTAITFLIQAVIQISSKGHDSFDTNVGDTSMSFVQIATNYLNSF